MVGRPRCLQSMSTRCLQSSELVFTEPLVYAASPSCGSELHLEGASLFPPTRCPCDDAVFFARAQKLGILEGDPPPLLHSVIVRYTVFVVAEPQANCGMVVRGRGRVGRARTL